MSRKLRHWESDAGSLFPPSPRDWLPGDHRTGVRSDQRGTRVSQFPQAEPCGNEGGMESGLPDTLLNKVVQEQCVAAS